MDAGIVKNPQEVFIWNVQAEDGKRKDRCVGSGKESVWEKRNVSESWEEQEASKYIS